MGLVSGVSGINMATPCSLSFIPIFFFKNSRKSDSFFVEQKIHSTTKILDSIPFQNSRGGGGCDGGGGGLGRGWWTDIHVEHAELD